eukprot:g15595.t1
MAGESEEQQPLTAATGSSSSSSSSNGSSARAPPEPAHSVGSYGTAAAAATTARPPDVASHVAAAVENGVSNGFGDIYGEQEKVEAGQRELIGATNGAATRAESGGASQKERAHYTALHPPAGKLSPSSLASCDPARLGWLPVHGEDELRAHLTKVSSRGSVCSSIGGSSSGCGFELTFRGRSPKFTRFGVLLLITLLPFGAHFVKSCFSSLETYFLEDPDLHFNETKYGSVMSAISIPNLFMPFFGGVFLDSKGHKTGIVLFLSLELVGHIIFTFAMGVDNFLIAVAGEVLHGFGSGAVVVAMRAVVSKFFLENELTFALGVTVAGACVSKTLAKASVAPIAETQWGYMGALWYVALWQLLSLAAGLVYVRLAASARNRVGMEAEEVEHKDMRVRSLLVALKRSTLSFWLVAVLHTLLIIAYHLFANYSGHFLYENYHVSRVLAGYISALSPLVVVVFAPIAGLIVDRWGRQLYVLLMANVVTIVAYFLLLQEAASPVVCILMLAFCESFVPTILLSALPLTVHPSVYGAAFGAAEVMSAIATIVANVFFGYSRDLTASYKDDLVFLVVLCFLCLAITVFLVLWDAQHCRALLNRGKSVMLLTDIKAMGLR